MTAVAAKLRMVVEHLNFPVSTPFGDSRPGRNVRLSAALRDLARAAEHARILGGSQPEKVRENATGSATEHRLVSEQLADASQPEGVPVGVGRALLS